MMKASFEFEKVHVMRLIELYGSYNMDEGWFLNLKMRT